MAFLMRRITSRRKEQVPHTYRGCNHQHGCGEHAAQSAFGQPAGDQRTRHHAHQRERQKAGQQSPVDAGEAQLAQNSRRGIQSDDGQRCSCRNARVQAGEQDQGRYDEKAAANTEKPGQEADCKTNSQAA